MPRGRKPKVKEEAVVEPKLTPAYYEKELAQRDQEQQIQLQELYKDLAKIKHQVGRALTHVGFIDSCESLAEAAFKAGRVYGPLDEVNDKLEQMLDNMYENNDLDHWDDINDN
ncbi:hypothetical protein EBQ81_06730 [bacterium]|nr:hypothetical protein [bacterium]